MTENIKKAILIGWPFLVFMCCCSSPKKQFYYFDHQQAGKKIELDTPVVYASFDWITKKVVIKKNDSIPSETLSKREQRGNLAIASIVFAPIAAIISFVSWPIGLGLAIVGVTMSLFAFWGNRRILAIIGFILSALAVCLALLVMSDPILQPGGNGFVFGPFF